MKRYNSHEVTLTACKFMCSCHLVVSMEKKIRMCSTIDRHLLMVLEQQMVPVQFSYFLTKSIQIKIIN